MKYTITRQEAYAAKVPHHIFNLNVLLTHLAISKIILELSHGNPAWFVLVPLISATIIYYIYRKSVSIGRDGSWFVAANWTLAWRRGRWILISYGIASVVILVSMLLGSLSGGLMMNDFSDDGGSSSIVEKIGLFFAAVVVFVTILINFLVTGISVYEAGKGEIDKSVVKFQPRNEQSNPEIIDEK